MARPKFTPTQSQLDRVQIMAGCGIPQSWMCAQIINKQTDKPLTLKTLRLAFKSQLSDGLVVANGLVSQALFKKALGKDPGAISAIIWWEKTRAGKRETLAAQPANCAMRCGRWNPPMQPRPPEQH